MSQAEDIAELKANQKVFARSLASGDEHFQKLDNNILEIKENIIKINHAVFGNGRKGIVDNIELIFQEIQEIKNNNICSKDVKEKVEKHENIVKGVNGVLFLFRVIGFGTLFLMISGLVVGIIQVAKVWIH